MHCAASAAIDSAASMVVALLTTLSNALEELQMRLPPGQLEALLVALHHTHHFCIFGSPPPVMPHEEQPPPPKALSSAVAQAQTAMAQQMPVVLKALLRA